MRKLILAVRLTAIALLLFCGVALKAQVVTTGNINGTVTDPTGAVIPGATITATNVDTNVQTQTTTDKDGLYNLRFLSIGNYKVLFHAQGFGDQVTPPFVLEVDQAAQMNAKLAPEGASTQVTVQATLAPLLNTEDATLATNLDARAIANIPLFGRTLTDLTELQPGAVATNPSSVGNSLSVNGSRNQGNNYSLNGMETNQNIDYGQAYNVNPDAVNQVQMVSGVPSAEYGNVEGATLLTVIKSGTNQYHGNAFVNLRNYLMDANTYGDKHTSGTITPRSAYTKYQIGGTLGGPIIKNKLFGFGDYQGYRYHATSHGFVSVPTYDERGCVGGLPGTTCNGGTMASFQELLDPAVMCNEVGNGCTTSAGAQRLIQLYDAQHGYTPFANNTGVPINNPVVKYLFAHPNLLPLPGSQLGINGVTTNATGVTLTDGGNGNNDAPGFNNVATVTKAFTHSNQYDIKIDYKLSSKDSLGGSYSHYNTLGYTTPTLPINFPSESPNPINIVTLDEIHTFSSSIVNDLRAGFMRYVSLGAQTIDTSGAFGTNGDNVLGIGSATGGIKQPFAGYAGQGSTVPATLTGSLTTYRSGGESEGGNANAGTNIVENDFNYADVLTWLKDKHTFKFGLNIIRYQQNNFYPGNDGSMGSIVATGNYTADLLTGGAGFAIAAPYKTLGDDNRGYAYSDYVQDYMSATATGSVQGYVGMRQYRDGYFVQDDWKLLKNLTLNLGFRYEYNTQISEVNNKYSVPDIVTQTIIVAGTAAANTYCPGCGRTLVHPFYGGALPRIGFNWALTPRFVLRAGYSALQFMEGTGANLRMTTNPPFQTTLEAVAGLPDTAGDPGVPFTEERGFGAAGAPATGGVDLVWAKNIRPAYVNNFTLTMQYQLNNTSSFSLGYVGKTGQHLVTAGGANSLPKPCTDPSFVTASNPAGINTKASSTISGPCLTSDPAPYQGVFGVGYDGQVKETNGNASENDNALQATFRQRIWHGLQYNFNFTWGKALTDATGFYNGSAYVQNFYNIQGDYAPTVEDISLVANWNMVYSLPLGRGRQFGANMNRVLDEVVGGWIVSMVGVEQTGLPTTASGVTSTNYRNGPGTERPNQYRPLKIVGRNQQHWFGTDPSATDWCTTSATGVAVDDGICAFGQPSLGTFGTQHYDNLRAPGNQVYNMDINKDFTIFHEHALNFRADALNVLNQSELSSPTTSLSGGSFGNITGVKSTNRQLQLTASYHF